MKLYVDLETLQLIEGPGFRNPVTSLRFKRGDAALLEVSFLEGSLTPVVIGDPLDLVIRFGVKPRNRYDIGYLVHSADWTMPAGDAENPVYRCAPSFNTQELDSALGVGSSTGSELSEITLMGEITWSAGTGEPTSTRTFLVVVENDVNRGTEGVPVSAEPPYPAPQHILIALPQSLTTEQKTQARANIGAIGEIADESLSIAKTAGLQSALNLKLGFRSGLAPGELDAGDSQQTLLLEKDGSVWLSKPDAGPIALVEASPPPPPPPPPQMLQWSCLSPGEGADTSSGTIELQPGNYQVIISAADFTTSSWGSHNLALKTSTGGTNFYNESSGTLYGLYPDQAGSWAVFYLADPATSMNPQDGTITLSVSDTAVFYIEGHLPMGGDTVDFTITFTPI